MKIKNRILTPKQAQSIVNIACASVWKPRLAQLWGKSIVMGEDIIINDMFYKEMRSACTNEQHKLFDDIFGKDVERFTAKKGDWVAITDFGTYGGVSFSYNKAYQLSKDLNTYQQFFGVEADDRGDKNGLFASVVKTMQFRFATSEEIKKATWFPNLTPCLVKSIDGNWLLRYSTENVGYFYDKGNKSGCSSVWGQYRKLDINNLP